MEQCWIQVIHCSLFFPRQEFWIYLVTRDVRIMYKHWILTSPRRKIIWTLGLMDRELGHMDSSTLVNLKITVLHKFRANRLRIFKRTIFLRNELIESPLELELSDYFRFTSHAAIFKSAKWKSLELLYSEHLQRTPGLALFSLRQNFHSFFNLVPDSFNAKLGSFVYANCFEQSSSAFALDWILVIA